MLSNSACVSCAVSTGILPPLTTYLGPRTATAGLNPTIWPTTSQSNSDGIAARCCFSVAGALVRVSSST